MNEPVRQPVYVFEGFRLDAQRRVLFGVDGQPISLTPRPFDTLLHLVERAGQLLTKEQLLEALWPNVVVEEHNLNKTISELRRVLGESPGEHRFIVTKPGRGYRFVADVSLESRLLPGAGDAPRDSIAREPAATVATPLLTSIEPPRVASRRRYSVWAFAMFAIVVLGAGLALVGNRAFGPAEPHLRLTPWSIYKGGQRGVVWSPDGRTTAYAARRSPGEPLELYVRDLGSPVDRSIARFVDAEVGMPAQWTADDKILFWDRFGLWSVSQVGAPPSLFAPIDFDFNLYGPTAGRVMHVTRDGKFVASIGRTDDGYVGVFTASLPEVKFTRYRPDPFATRGGHNNPILRFSPDGKQLLLWRNARQGAEEAWLLPFPADASRPPRRVLEELPVAYGTPDFSWLPDNRHIVISAGPERWRELYLGDTLSGRLRRLSSGPVGPSDQIAPAVSPDGDKLVYTDRRPDFDVVTLDLRTAAVEPLIYSEEAEQMPAWAARAHALVYVTRRSGEPEIWLHQPPQPDRPLVTARDFPTETQLFVSPALSPDGARVIYQRVEGPNANSSLLWMSAVGGGKPEQLTNESLVESGGSWSPDGAWFVYFAHDGGSDILKKVKTTGRQCRRRCSRTG